MAFIVFLNSGKMIVLTFLFLDHMYGGRVSCDFAVTCSTNGINILQNYKVDLFALDGQSGKVGMPLPRSCA